MGRQTLTRRAAARLRRLLPHEARRAAGLDVGEHVVLPPGSNLPNTTIGRYTRFNGPVQARGSGAITIGSFCAVGHDSLLISQNHDPNRVNLQVALRRKVLGLDAGVIPEPIEIGHNVWVGDRVTFLAGSQTGTGCIIGAGAVVTGEIPPFSIAGGVPARLIRPRCHPELRDFLLELAWWEWPIERIARNSALLDADLSQVSVEDLLGFVAP